jgi:hypothetical protein
MSDGFDARSLVDCAVSRLESAWNRVVSRRKHATSIAKLALMLEVLLIVLFLDWSPRGIA